MDRSFTSFKLTVAAAWTMMIVAGCGQSSTPNPSAQTAAPAQPAAGGAVAATVADPTTDPAARAAYEFLHAVLVGDTQLAGAQLTPAAMQRLVESDIQFAPPGLDQATFRIGEVRKPSDTQALVQCILTASTPTGETHSEEMCCLMKLVDNSWRVSGIAYSTGADRPPMILDFENPPQAAATPSAMADGTISSPPQPATAGRPSPGAAPAGDAGVYRQ